MKLIFLLIIGLLQSSFGKKCDVLGRISKSYSQTTSSKNYCVYIDTYDFEKETEIGIKVTVYEGYFEESIMYHIGDNDIPSVLYPTYYESYYSSSYSGYDYGYYTYYDRYTYYFKIPKPSERYLFVSIPDFYIRYYGYVEIEIEDPFPVWAIILIVLGVIVFIAIIIIVIIYFIRKSRKISTMLPISQPVYYPSNNAYVNNPPAYAPPPGYTPPPGAPIYQPQPPTYY